jgi:tissue factor pathway inhibitor 2
VKVKNFTKKIQNKSVIKMNCKINSLLIVAMLASIVLIVECNPIDFFTQFTDETDRVLLKRLADYFTGDESDESSASLSTSSSNGIGIKTRDEEILERAENCRLPMKRGLCRALLPRWR